MGSGIAHTFALYGYKVSLIDSSAFALEKALDQIRSNLDRQVKKATISSEDKSVALANIVSSEDLHQSADADFVIEAIVEDDTLKLNLFQELDAICKPDAILASNTSSISISHLATATKRPEKVIGMHFMNPVPLMKLVEVIKGNETSDDTLHRVMDLALKLEKVPVEVFDAPGFVSNRVLMPMINEAIYTLYEGIAGVEEIDTVMVLGMSHPMGPLQLADYIGLDVCLAILKVMQVGFDSSKYTPCPLLTDMVEHDQKGIKTGLGFYDYSNGVKEAKPAVRFSRT